MGSLQLGGVRPVLVFGDARKNCDFPELIGQVVSYIVDILVQ